MCGTVNILALVFLTALCVGERDFTRSDSCAIPQLRGHGNLAFTGTIERLVQVAKTHLTVIVKVSRIIQGAGKLAKRETIRNVHHSTSCGHNHRIGDERIWLVKRHSSGHLTITASLSITETNMRRVQQVLRG